MTEWNEVFETIAKQCETKSDSSYLSETSFLDSAK